MLMLLIRFIDLFTFSLVATGIKKRMCHFDVAFQFAWLCLDAVMGYFEEIFQHLNKKKNKRAWLAY